MIRLSIENKIEVIRHIVKYQRLYHGTPVEHTIECVNTGELEKAKRRLTNMLIPFEAEELAPTEAELAHEGMTAGSLAEAEARIAGAWKEPVTLEELQAENERLKQENEVNQAAIVELAGMIAEGGQG